MTSKLLPWDEVSAGAVEQRRILGVRTDLVRSQATRKELQVDRLVVADWVNVVALAGDNMLFVRQWRFGSRAFSLEIPAGALEPGEDVVTGGLRELREETGFVPRRPGDVRLLGAVKPNPAFQANHCSTILVPDAVDSGALDPDEHEEIEVVRVPRSAVPGLVLGGEIDSALVVVALYLHALCLGSPCVGSGSLAAGQPR